MRRDQKTKPIQKVMDYSSKITRPLIAREISIMKTLNKMNLKGCVKLIDYFLSQKKAIIVEELLEKDLEKYSFKNVLSEDELWLVAETLAKLLKVLLSTKVFDKCSLFIRNVTSSILFIKI